MSDYWKDYGGEIKGCLIEGWEPKKKKDRWMHYSLTFKGEKPSKLMAVRMANAILKEAGIEMRLDELNYS
jgi:hypothetical protein